MTRMLLRLTSSLGLTVCLSLAFTPVGCGGSQAGTVAPSRAVHDDPPVPPGTFAAMMACVTEAQGRLSERVYTVQLDVEVNESGEAGRVKLRDSIPGEPALEACLADVLVGMALPLAVLDRLGSETAVTPASRGVVGQVWEEALVVGAGINLAPIFLTAAVVTVTVVVGVQATTDVIDAIRRRRKRKETCLEMYITCANIPPLCTLRRDSSYMVCSRCQDNCNAGNPYSNPICTQCGFR